MKRLRTIIAFLALTAANCFAYQVLWTIDILGEEGQIENMDNMSFIDFFENHTIPNRAETEGIDVVARTSSGIILPWIYTDVHEITFSSWLGKDIGSDWEYTTIGNPQLILDSLPEGDSVQLLAGFFDWDNVDYDLDVDMDKFTAFAVAEYPSPIFRGIYNPGSMAPPTYEQVRSWNAFTVPEPSTALLAIFGAALLLHRRKHNA